MVQSALDYGKDFIGILLNEGDIVAVTESGDGSSGLILGQVIGFTAKKIRVQYINKNGRSSDRVVLKNPWQVSKIAAENMQGMPAEWIQAVVQMNLKT